MVVPVLCGPELSAAITAHAAETVAERLQDRQRVALVHRDMVPSCHYMGEALCFRAKTPGHEVMELTTGGQ